MFGYRQLYLIALIKAKRCLIIHGYLSKSISPQCQFILHQAKVRKYKIGTLYIYIYITTLIYMHMFMNIHRYCFIEAFKPLTRTATKGKYYLISLLNYFLGGQLYRIQLRWTGFVSTLKPFSSFNKGESSCCFIDFFHQLLCILYEIIIWKNTWSIYLQYNFQFY